MGFFLTFGLMYFPPFLISLWMLNAVSTTSIVAFVLSGIVGSAITTIIASALE